MAMPPRSRFWTASLTLGLLACRGSVDVKPGNHGDCTASPCEDGQVCISGTCVQSLGSCTASSECQNDSYCESGLCIPYGSPAKTHDPSCQAPGFPLVSFSAPQVVCSWTESSVIMTPVVVDLDGDQRSEIVLVTYATAGGAGGGHLVALRGDSCEKVFDRIAGLGQRSQLAVGDLSGDGRPEIVGISDKNEVMIFDQQGELLATSPPAQVTAKDGGPALAELDGVAPPEIIYGGMALSLSGDTLTALYNVAVEGGQWGALSAVADVDLDGHPEVVVGNRILDGLSGADKTPEVVKGWPGGYVAVAEFDPLTPEPEIVLVSSHSDATATIRIYHPKTGELVFGPQEFSSNAGGPPTVVDVDGDQTPEVAVAGTSSYVLLDTECTQTPLPTFCHSAAVRWLKQIKEDSSSGCTGSSAFDLNGDGIPELLHRDQCWLRAYDGKTGEVRLATSSTSGTLLELPIVADLDRDGHAEIVLPSHLVTGTGLCQDEPELKLSPAQATQGIAVLRDAERRWMPARPIWNQYTYHLTNITDEGSVPLQETPSWSGWNSYRQNAAGLSRAAPPAPDLTALRAAPSSTANDCTMGWVLEAQICNRGASSAAAGLSGTFYRGDPRGGGAPLCSGVTTQTLAPGACERVSCTESNPPRSAIDLWFVADDSGKGGREGECQEQNNRLHLPEARCR